MATQVEHLENHTARLTVNISREAFEQAMKDAAKRIATKINIPGFRKGKAPYNIVMRYVGQPALLEEAMEHLGQQVYRDALNEAQIEPYAPGEISDIKTEPEVVITFEVAKQPEVDLGAYRDVRLPFEPPLVEDSQVDDAIKRMVESRALIEPVERGAQLGDKVKFTVYGEVFHEHGHDEHAHNEAEAAEADDATTAPAGDAPDVKSETQASPQADPEALGDDAGDEAGGEVSVEEFVDDEMDDVLTDDPQTDLVPGFSAHLVGLAAGEEKTFRVRLPADFREARFANHEVEFRVKVLEVRSRTLPALNDDFAKLVSDGEVDNLLDFRIRIRKNLQDFSTDRFEREYADKVLDQMIAGATLKFPPQMIEEAIDDVLTSLDRNLRDSGLTLDYFKQMQRKTDADLRQDYQQTAIKRVQRSLVLGDVARAEGVNVTREDIATRVEATAAAFGDQQEQFRKFLTRPDNQQNIALELLTEATLKRIAAIGKGENPPLPATAAPTSQVESVAEEPVATEATPPPTSQADPAAPPAETPTP